MMTITNLFRIITLLHFIVLVPNVYCSNLMDTALYIASSEYDPSLTTVVLFKYDDEMDASSFLSDYPGCVSVVRVKNNNNSAITHLYNKDRVRQTIFIAKTPENFEYIAKIIKRDIVISTRGILVLAQPGNRDVVTKATKAAWENDIGDFVVITDDLEEVSERINYVSRPNTIGDDSDNSTTNFTDIINPQDTEIKIWTYIPYGNGECGNYTAVILNSTVFFPNKFSNFHRCPIKLTLLHFIPYLLIEKDNGTVISVSGIDGDTLQLIIDKLNASSDIVQSTDRGGIGTYVNGKATGSFADLVEGIADIMAPAILLTDKRYPKSQISYVYQTLDVYWCGPNQREIHAWAKVLLPFLTNITPFIILTFVIFIIATKIIRRYDLNHPDRRRGVFFMSFVMFLGQEVNFETNSWLVNSLFMLWIIFCMIVRIGYQGDLVEGLQKALLEPPLGLLEEAITKVDGFGGVEVFSHYYSNTSVADKYTSLKLGEIPTYIEEIADGKRFLLATDILLVKWFKQTLQVLDEPLTRAAVCLFMRSGWPAAEETTRLTYIITETGLIEKIMDDFRYDWLLHSGQTNDARDAKPLDMAILGACFYGLLVMHLVCFIIFCAEIICHKYELKSKCKRKFKVK